MVALLLKEYVVREHITQSVAVGWTSPATHPRTVTFVMTEGTCSVQHLVAREGLFCGNHLKHCPLRVVLASQVNMQCLTEETLVTVIAPSGTDVCMTVQKSSLHCNLFC